jgi:purine-binding chemotaxis protein CheW
MQFDENSFEPKQGSMSAGIFAIRGELDGEEKQDFVDANKYIGLLIAKEEFLIPIEKISEIIMVGNMTWVPRGPKHVEGVINLRGQIIPAISLRSLMDHPSEVPTSSSRIIIVRYESFQIGLIVDGITYAVSIPKASIESHSLTAKGSRSELISEIAKRGDQVNGVLDVNKVSTIVNGGKPVESVQEAA